MRSRSSVLSHILGSNSQVCGYSELHIPYIDESSLEKMHDLLADEHKCILSNKFLLDKILHDYELTDKVLEVTKPKVIFLLREPENTLKSIINMGYLTGIEWYKNPEKALKYYNDRLSQLEKLSKQVAGDYCFIESDDLVNTPESILEKLTHWLNLKQPLKKEYSIFKNTGKPGYGDPSENIKSGVLEQTRRYPKIIIPPEILQQGKISYSKCKEALLKGRIS